MFCGSADWSSPTQTYRVLLATDEYKPSRTHRFVSEVTGELEGGGYQRQDLKGRAVLASDVTGAADCVADAVKFTKLRSTQTYRWAIVFRVGKTDKDSELICALDVDLDGGPGTTLRAVTEHTIRLGGESGRVFSIQGA